MSREDQVECARVLLAVDDQRIALDTRQPGVNEDGLPFDRDAWLSWYSEIQQMFLDLDVAYNRLIDSGVQVRARHPMWYRPVCEALVRSES